MMLKLAVFLLAPILAQVAVAPSVYCEQGNDKGVVLRIRTIKACRPVNETGIRNVKGVRNDVVNPFPAEITDLRPQLENLPYRRFKLLASQEVPLQLKKHQLFRLRNGELLGLRLLYRNGERAGISLDWHDIGGAEILTTRLHFNCSGAVVTGTNKSRDRANILALSVVP
jgi:hypothetical protein